MPTSKSAGLTDKQEAFAAAFVLTANAAESYRQAYDVEPNARDGWIYTEALQLLDHPRIAPRIEELKEKAKRKSEYTVLKALEELEEARVLGTSEAQTGAVVSAINSKIKLLGLDKPTKVQEIGPDGQPKKDVSTKDLARAIGSVMAEALANRD